MTLFFTISVIISSMLMALVFFVLTARNKDVFYSYFRWSWLSYSCGFAAIILALNTDFTFPLVLKAFFDMISILAFLYAIYHLFHLSIPDSWVKWTVFTTLWVSIATYLNLDLFIICIPMAIYDLVMAFFICYAVYLHFKRSALNKFCTIMLISMFGLFKICFALFPIQYASIDSAIALEFFFTIIFTVFISLFYSLIVKKELAYTEERFQMMIENSRDAFFHCTLMPKLHFEYVTPSIINILGYSPSDFYVNPNLIFAIIQNDYLNAVNDIFLEDKYSNFPKIEVVKCFAKNGEPRDIELHCSPVTDISGNTIGINGSIRDVTQLHKAQASLMDAREDRQRMLSYVSHELKTPITSILGFATALQDGTYTTEEEKQRAVDVIIDKAIFTKRMIEDLSQLSKLETHQYEFAYELLKCNELASKIRKSTITELENSKIRFKYQIDYDKLSKHIIIADSIRVCQVILNLVNNSIRYTKKKNVITVKCGIDKPDANMIISVSDKGTGIAPDDIKYVFNRFFQAGHSSTSQGRGLGLAISKEIVEAHNGDISVKSSYGHGTTFTISLPLYFEQEGCTSDG